MTRPRLSWGSATDVGLVRSLNEDALLAHDTLFVVADGMGGHHGGAVASRVAVEMFAELDPLGADAAGGIGLVTAALTRAQRRIRAWGEAHPHPDGRYAGTTVAAAVAVEEAGEWLWLVANVGDSRVYRFSPVTGLEQVSVDHSVVQQLVEAGRITTAEAAVHPERHVITRALGSPDGVHPEFFLTPLLPGERLLVCSDGINTMVEDHRIEQVLLAGTSAQQASDALVAAALAAGGRDNATAVVVDVVGWADS